MPNPRLPTKIKQLKGTYKKSRENPDEPDLELIAVPAPPEGLSALEREFWARLKAMVDAVGVFTAADAEGFRAMVRVRALFEAASTAEEPDLKSVLGLSRDVKAWFTAFGLTPQSRSILKRAPSQPQLDELDTFFAN